MQIIIFIKQNQLAKYNPLSGKLFSEFRKEVRRMKLNGDEVRTIASEARLSLSGDELGKVVRYMNNFLDMVDRFKELDLNNVEPFCFAEKTECPFREDRPEHFDQTPEILIERAEGSLFKVPRIMEE